MIDPITRYRLTEGYVLSDKTISVNLSEFETGKINKLLVIGVMGSGKTTIGEKLAKRYKCKWISTDSFWWRLKQKYFKDDEMNRPELEEKIQPYFEKEMRKYLMNNERVIIEGINLLENKYRSLVIKKPMIILGLSSIRAGFRAGKRNKQRGEEEAQWKLIYWMTSFNIRNVEGKVKELRKQVRKIPDVDIKEYKI